jgi:hypothetical protein
MDVELVGARSHDHMFDTVFISLFFFWRKIPFFRENSLPISPIKLLFCESVSTGLSTSYTFISPVQNCHQLSRYLFGGGLQLLLHYKIENKTWILPLLYMPDK